MVTLEFALDMFYCTCSHAGSLPPIWAMGSFMLVLLQELILQHAYAHTHLQGKPNVFICLFQSNSVLIYISHDNFFFFNRLCAYKYYQEEHTLWVGHS